jgi:uncharacterized protein YyaL (SSP411 family)
MMDRVFPLTLAAGLAVLGTCAWAASEPPDSAPKEPLVSHAATTEPKHTNELIHETSPYLLQHAHNPVNWFPWGEKAFAKARAEGKPIFLSVGYSSCHWCHVMERESFENEEVARVLNESFISVKVDREERPDVDEIYMTVVQLITQRGGWPMTVFMTADGKPFFGGTYFPPDDRYGRIGLVSLANKVSDVWKTQNEKVHHDAERISDAVRDSLANKSVPSEGPLDESLLQDAVQQLRQNFDDRRGGFGDHPKFPPNNGLPLLLQLRDLLNSGEPFTAINSMNTLTLDQMALGGIHDHVGGGFHRYSTDGYWLLPHFEKMLYDNALLSKAYAIASKTYGNPEYERVARDTYDWVLREMTDANGGFYSSLDADSEGEEGKFYVWDKKEIDKILGADGATFCSLFNVLPSGNFKDEASGHDTGLNILHLTQPLATHAKRMNVAEAALRTQVDAWKAKLLAVRIKRVWPGLDDKILTSWNALMISSLARGAVLLNESRYKDAAVKAAEFLLKNARTHDGRWLATHRKGQSKLPAYLDDHSFMAVAFLDLFDATKDERWKSEAIKIVELMDKHFSDGARGGYFFTSDDHEKLLARTKDPTDKAIPSGNGWAAIALVRLSELSGEKRYSEKAVAIIKEFQGLMERAPQATESLLEALTLQLNAKKKRGESVRVPEVIKDESAITRGAVKAELIAGFSALKRGSNVPIAVRFIVENGWHIQAETPDDMSAIGAGYSLRSRTLGQLAEPVFPAPKTLNAPELGGELKVYSGTVIAKASLTISADAPLGRHALVVRAHFQACNDRVCQKPEEVLLSLPIDVVAADAEVTATNTDVFGN